MGKSEPILILKDGVKTGLLKEESVPERKSSIKITELKIKVSQ